MPDMQTALTSALKSPAATVKVKSQQEQIWLWIKDHPASTVKRLKADLKHIKGSNISSLTSQMVDRKMLEVTNTPVKPVPRFGRAVVQCFSVPASMKAYEILPMPLKPKPVQQPLPTPKPVEAPAAPAPAAPAEQKPAAPTEQKPAAPTEQKPAAPTEQKPAAEPKLQKQATGVDVHLLPVGEALRLYRELKALFGDIQ